MTVACSSSMSRVVFGCKVSVQCVNVFTQASDGCKPPRLHMTFAKAQKLNLNRCRSVNLDGLSDARIMLMRDRVCRSAQTLNMCRCERCGVYTH